MTAMTYTEYPDDAIIEIRLDGRVTREDYDAVIDKVQDFIDAHGTIKLIEIIDSFKGFDPSALWAGLKFDIRNVRHVSHVAVVSDIGWMGPAAKAAGAVITSDVRTFDLDELDDAWAWLRDA